MKRLAALATLLGITIFGLIASTSSATLISTTGARHYVAPPAGGGEGNDGLVVSNYANYDPDAASVISLDVNSTVKNWGTTGGSSITFTNESWWSGTTGVATMFPPTIESGSGLGDIDLWKEGAKTIHQVNIRWEYQVSATYCGDTVGHPKLIIVRVYDALGSETVVARPMMFLENMDLPDGSFTEQENSLFLVLSQGTTRMFATTNLVPGPSSGDWVESSPGPSTNPMLQPFFHRATGGTDSGGNVFIPASEIVTVEMRINVLSTTDEPNGVIAYRFYRRNGEVYERGAAWDWEAGHTPGTGNFIADIDTFGGGYYNDGNPVDPDLWVKVGRRITLGFNLEPTVGRHWIGPAEGFVQNFFLPLLVLGRRKRRKMLGAWKRLLVALSLLGLAGGALADATAIGTPSSAAGSGTTPSTAHTVAAGTDVSYICIFGGSGTTISSINSFGGVTPQLVGDYADALHLYRVVSPASGGTTAQATLSGTALWSIHVMDVDGADTADPDDTPVTNTTSELTEVTATVTSAASDLVVACGLMVSDNIAASSGATLSTEEESIDSAFLSSAMVYEAGAASVVLGVSTSGSFGDNLIIATNVNAAAGGGGLTQVRMLENIRNGAGPHRSQQLGGALEGH